MIDKQLELKRLQLITKIGEKLYYYHRNELEHFDELKDIFEELREIDITISKNTDGYMITKHIVKCPECQNDIDRDDKFCNSCGFNIAEYIVKYDLQCDNCKSFLIQGNKYCPFCGFKIDSKAE